MKYSNIKINCYVLKFFIFIICLSGCGYSFQGAGSVLPKDIKTIYIPQVINRSTEPVIGRLLTEALRERFERFGVVKVTDVESEGDATLEVEVIQVKTASNTSVAVTDIAQELTTTMTVSGRLVRPNGLSEWYNPLLNVARTFGNVSGAVITSSSQFAQSGLSSADVDNLSQRELTRSQEDQAFQLLAEDVSRIIYDDAVAPEF
jgi:outer membrane lipopolysaccharide assembly protein LptE/RlpB